MEISARTPKDFYSFSLLDKNSQKPAGFTLIELLVVIAIISLLVTLSLIAIAHYRNNAKDTRIEVVLSQVRSIAAMIYNDKSSYESLCAEGTLNSADSKLAAIKKDVEKFNGGTSPTCYASSSAFCVSSPLATAGSFCVDFGGYAGDTLGVCGSSYICQSE